MFRESSMVRFASSPWKSLRSAGTKQQGGASKNEPGRPNAPRGRELVVFTGDARKIDFTNTSLSSEEHHKRFTKGYLNAFMANKRSISLLLTLIVAVAIFVLRINVRKWDGAGGQGAGWMCCV